MAKQFPWKFYIAELESEPPAETLGCFVCAKTDHTAKKQFQRFYGAEPTRIVDTGGRPSQTDLARLYQMLDTSPDKPFLFGFDHEILATQGILSRRFGHLISVHQWPTKRWEDRIFSWSQWRIHPEGEPQTEYSIESVSKLLADLAVLGGAERTLLFRGHEDYMWGLFSELDRYRFTTQANDERTNTESQVLNTFRHYAAAHIEVNGKSDLELLALGRHYGLPTRLLDWSENPLVGLYFAVGQGRRFYDAALLMRIVKANSEQPKANRGGHSLEELRKLPRTIFFPPPTDSRMTAQASVFTIEPDPAESELVGSNIEDMSEVIRLHISSTRFEHIRQELAMIGINERTMFPGLEGICRDIRLGRLKSVP